MRTSGTPKKTYWEHNPKAVRVTIGGVHFLAVLLDYGTNTDDGKWVGDWVTVELLRPEFGMQKLQTLIPRKVKRLDLERAMLALDIERSMQLAS